MKILIFILIGIAGGVMGGMGMGGGTLLIPLLTAAAGVEQHLAQAINLVAFIPMSIAALIVHIKNKLVRFKYVAFAALPAAAASVGAAFLSRRVGGAQLSHYFGFFLIALGCFQLVCALLALIKKKRDKKNRVEYSPVYASPPSASPYTAPEHPLVSSPKTPMPTAPKTPSPPPSKTPSPTCSPSSSKPPMPTSPKTPSPSRSTSPSRNSTESATETKKGEE